MRRILFVFTGLILLALISIYVFIPQVIVVSKVERVESSERIISQLINDPVHRARWWIKSSTSDLINDEFRYDFMEPGYNSSTILISNSDNKYPSKIIWIPYANNTIELRWKTSLRVSLNPVRRVRQYITARRLKSDMAAKLERLLKFAINPRNIYNINIERQTVQDTLFATMSFTSAQVLETDEVYQIIDSLRSYINNQGAVEVNAPMLNVSQNSEGFYITTIALPIDKPITPSQNVLINRMVRGNILVAEVKGGPGTIKNAYNQIEAYMKDFKLTPPAIPYESLITDRRMQADSSNWVTKIYYPIY